MCKKLWYIAAMLILMTAITGEKKMAEVNYADLNSDTKIIGSLGKPLGEIITVTGTVLEDNARGMKSDEGKKLLKVFSVNNSKLKEPVIIDLIKFDWVSVKDPKPGMKYSYIGYETGGMSGIPHEAFEYMPAATTEDYHFGVYFVACKEK